MHHRCVQNKIHRQYVQRENCRTEIHWNGKERKSLPRKIAMMVMSLVKESLRKPNKEIEEEILKELEEELRIPWVERVEKVTVLESTDD